MSTPSNSDDVIDSRDIIERLEELEAMRRPFVAGWNMPGYMPDNEPAAFETFEDAQAYIREEMERHAEEAAHGVAREEAAEAFRAALERLDESESEFGETIDEYHYWITDTQASNFEDPEDSKEYEALKSLADEASDCSSDWTYGETLIRHDYWRTYVQELLEDCGDIPANIPHYIEIDWQATARNIAVDYTTVSFDGVDYYIRSC
jgi:hypothetical protein